VDLITYLCDLNAISMKHTEIILREDGSLYREVDYIDDLEIRIKIVTGEIEEKLYYKNDHNGMSLIDKYGCTDTYQPFECVGELLMKLVQSQMRNRSADYRKENY